MKNKITFLTVSILLATLACLSPRVFAQTFDLNHASGLVLAGSGTDPVHTLTISVASVGTSTSITFPGANAAGVLVNNGSGTLSWSAIGVAPGLANQILVTNGSSTVLWQGLAVNTTDFSGNGVGTNLAIASTAGNDIITALNTGTPTSPIDVAAGGTGLTSAPSNGQLLIGNGTSFTLGTLATSGSGISVTNGSGTITLANTGVTSLAYTGDALYGSIGSATGAVTLAPALNTQNANLVFAGPASGPAAAPTFRSLVSADLPGGSGNYIENQYTAQTSAGFNITAGAPAETSAFAEATILNNATSSTSSIAKTGLALSSTGSWTGTSATKYRTGA